MTDSVSFRSARSDDFAAVRDLAEQLAAHIEAPLPSLTLDRFVRFYVNDDAPLNLLLAVRGDRVLGMIAWILTHELYSADACVYISDIAVDSTVRGQGIGKALMAQAKAWARAHGAQKLAWDVWARNSTALAFYERFGAKIDREAITHILTFGDD
jgi:GNAT superfamily N-acetyltransferase